jgi:hypothetical protein
MTNFEPPAFDAITLYGMSAIAFAMSVAWWAAVKRQSRRYGMVTIGLLSTIWIVAWLGDRWTLFSRVDILPSPFVVVALACTLIALALALSRVGETLARGLRADQLVALQVFRFPLEMLMWRAATLSIMPVEFSLRGYNFDFLTGIGAIVLVVLIRRWQVVSIRLLWLWNLFGIACLCVIGVLAVLTSTTVRAFGDEPEHINSWVLFFPYSLLPFLLVSFAVFGHVLLTRKLRQLTISSRRIAHPATGREPV